MEMENTNEIAAALAKAQAVMQNAKYNKVNPHFRNKYADLAAIIDAVKKPLTDNGIAFSQVTHIIRAEDGWTFTLYTTLHHTSGQSIRTAYPLPFMPDKPQVMGSALTYARRYSLASIAGISAEEDLDANGVAEETAKRASPQPGPDILQMPSHFNTQNDPEFGKDVKPPFIAIEDMAREAAQRGKEVMRQFYRSRSKQDRDRIDAIKSDLDQLVDAAESGNTAYEGEGS